MRRKQKGQAYHAHDFILAQDQTSAHQSDACRISKSNLSFEQDCWLSYACHFQIFSQLPVLLSVSVSQKCIHVFWYVPVKTICALSI